MTRWSAGALLLLALLLAPTTAVAGGFTIPLVGARMSGQAAFLAYPDDTTAIYHNPAGLVLVPQMLSVDVSGTGILTNTAYTRDDYPQAKDAAGKGTGEFDTSRAPSGSCPAEGAATGYDAQGYVLQPCKRSQVTPASRFGTIPFGGLAYRPGFADLAFGLGLYSPHNATAAFPNDGPQRYLVTEGSITTVYLTPTVAWRPHPALALGAGASHISAHARYRRALWIGPLKPLNPDELMLDLDASGSAYGWDAGLIFFPGELLPALGGLEVGATYISRADLEFAGQLRVTGASAGLATLLSVPDYKEGDTISRDADASFTLPDTLKVGLGYRFGERAWVGVDLYWNHYTLYDKLTIKLRQPLGTLEQFEDRKDSSDCWTLTAGGRYTVLPSLDLRLGFFADQSPYPDKYYSIMSPDADKLGGSAGISWRLGWGFELSAAYMILFYKDRVVTDSELRPSFTVLGSTSEAPFSANGEVVDKRVHIFGLQLGWAWGK